MASYLGSYTNDFGYQINGALLPVYLIQNNRRLNTSDEFDSQFLTSTFTNHASLSTNNKGCEIVIVRLRQLIINLGEDLDLFITLPFVGGTVKHIDLLNEINNLTNYNFFCLSGEIHRGMIEFYVK